jgi:hypothetical protein
VRSSPKKNINHKEHKELKGREARKIKFLRPLRLSHPKGTAMAVPFFVTFVLFVVKSLSPFRCGVAAVAIGVFPPR